MSGSSPSGNTTVTQTSAPNPDQRPFLMGEWNAANQQFNGQPGAVPNPIQYYPGQTLAPVSPLTNQAIGLQAGRALSGSPVTAGAQQNATDTLNGKYLMPGSNPFLQQTYDLAAGNMRSAIDGQFEGAGRYGSGAQAGALANGYANLGNQIYGGNYQQERQRQIAEQAFAPGLANQDYGDISQLAGAGAAQQQNQQNQINDSISRFNFGQTSPWNTLGLYGNLIGGNYGQQGQTTTPYFSNPTSNALSAGIGLAGIGNLTGAFGNGGLLSNLFGTGINSSGFAATAANDVNSLPWF